MPGGMINEETVLAGVVFALIKLVAYYFVAKRFALRYLPNVQAAPPLLVALSRIALGAVLAAIVAMRFQVDNTLPWYLLLLLLRVVEWAAIVWLFYERLAGEFDFARLAMFTGVGTLVSCLLDLPAVLGAIAIPIMAYGIC